jgi:conjugal transfer pilus assembly protein TraB
VIDESVKGVVQDSDGTTGLKGTPVARFGKALYSATVAGVFKGVGDVMKASASITTVASGSTTQVVDKGQLTTGAIGGGLGGAFDTMHDFFMKLVQMQMPVIESGAKREVTLIVSEGKILKIKDFRKGKP